MKKVISLGLVLIMLLSLCACGGSKINAKSIVGSWISLYSGEKLTLNSDKSMSLGNNTGTWSLDGTYLTINYTYEKSGTIIEKYFDIVDENENKVLKSRKQAKFNGETSNISTSEYYQESVIENIRSAILKKAEDTVSTDILEVTVHSAVLSYSAVGAQTSTSDGRTTNISKACLPPSDNDYALYKANKGHSLLCVDFTLKNTDRDSLNTSDYIVSFSVNQNGNSSSVNGYDLNNANGSYGLNLSHMPISTNEQDFKTNDTGNIIMRAGETDRIKYVGIFGFDADLSAAFDLVVEIKSSDGNTEKFIYAFEV